MVDQGADEGLGAVHPVPPLVADRVAAGSKMVPGIEDALRVEGRLDPAHEVQLDRVLELGQVRPLLGADAVLAGDGAAQRTTPAAMMSCRSRWRTSGSGCQTERWTLPSPACPQPTTSDEVAAASSPTASRKAGIEARGTTTSTMSSAPLAFAAQKARSRAAISWAPAWSGRT